MGEQKVAASIETYIVLNVWNIMSIQMDKWIILH